MGRTKTDAGGGPRKRHGDAILGDTSRSRRSLVGREAASDVREASAATGREVSSAGREASSAGREPSAVGREVSSDGREGSAVGREASPDAGDGSAVGGEALRDPREASSEERAPGVHRPRYYRERFERALGVPFTDGNAVEPLLNGVEIFPAMLEAIRASRRSVDFLTFIYWTGDVAIDFANALSDAAARGVRVRVLLDAVGAGPMDERLTKQMTDAGARVEWFRPVVRWKIWESVKRTHRKVLICDGRVGFTGGVGIAEEWEGDASGPDEWREVHFRIVGPAVAGLEAAFLGDWMEVDPSAASQTFSSNVLENAGSSAVQVLRSTSSVGWTDLALAFHTLISSAAERIRISTPYFVPDDFTVELLSDAACAGVSVEILVPGPHVDHRVSLLAGESEFGRLLDAGIDIRLYQPTMIHQKILTADGALSMIGSGNFNFRSMRHDDEIQLVVVDPELTSRLDDMLDEDFRHGEPLDPVRWRRRGPLRRGVEAASRLVRYQA